MGPYLLQRALNYGPLLYGTIGSTLDLKLLQVPGGRSAQDHPVAAGQPETPQQRGPLGCAGDFVSGPIQAGPLALARGG